MALGEFQVLQKHNPCVTLLRNFLKLRKQRRLADERGERPRTGTSVSHEKSGEARLSVQLKTEEDDWREVCLPPILCIYF